MLPVRTYERIKCEDCGGFITSHDSCECGTTMQDMLEAEQNDIDLGVCDGDVEESA